MSDDKRPKVPAIPKIRPGSAQVESDQGAAQEVKPKPANARASQIPVPPPAPMFANDQLAAMHKRMTFEVQHVSAQLNQVAQEKNRIRQRLNTLADQEQQLNGCLLEINATCEWLGIDLTKEPPETSSEEAPPAAPLGSESGDEAAQTE